MNGKWISIGLLFLMVFSLSCAIRATGHRAPFPETQALVRDISLLENRLARLVSSSDALTMKVIGEVDYGEYKAPVWVISFSPSEESKYRVFLSGGVHGNEPVSVEILLEMIEALAENPQRYGNVSFDIVPVVNPWGWSHDIRFNRDGRDVNRDFASFKSQESRIIEEFMDGKKYYLMIDHHEDPDAKGFYIYQYGNPDTSLSRKVIEAVRNAGHPIEQDVSMIILKTENGLINAPMWGLWYMKLTRQLSITNYFRLNNSKKVYTIETPTRLGWEDRMIMHRTALKMFLDSLGGNFGTEKN